MNRAEIRRVSSSKATRYLRAASGRFEPPVPVPPGDGVGLFPEMADGPDQIPVAEQKAQDHGGGDRQDDAHQHGGEEAQGGMGRPDRRLHDDAPSGPGDAGDGADHRLAVEARVMEDAGLTVQEPADGLDPGQAALFQHRRQVLVGDETALGVHDVGVPVPPDGVAGDDLPDPGDVEPGADHARHPVPDVPDRRRYPDLGKPAELGDAHVADVDPACQRLLEGDGSSDVGHLGGTEGVEPRNLADFVSRPVKG